MSSELADLHKQSFKNRKLIEDGDACGCFYCLKLFQATDIVEWWDDNQTAVCPLCKIDSVMPGKLINYDWDILVRLNKKYF